MLLRAEQSRAEQSRAEQSRAEQSKRSRAEQSRAEQSRKQSRAEQSRAEQSRATYIDIAKAIGIICVLIGHSFTADCIGILIYAFHMPLFFSL